MSNSASVPTLDEQIDQWRSYLRRRQAIQAVDVAELEDHLREQVAGLTEAGLAEDEAFLVAVKRMGDLDSLSREFAREHSERLWKQLVVPPAESDASRNRVRLDGIVAFCLAIAAALLVKLPASLGFGIQEHSDFYIRNATLFALPLLIGYFIWKRDLSKRMAAWLAGAVAAALIFANAYPFAPKGSTEILTALHVGIALWIVVGAAYAAERWREVAGRMDFIRFSGELFIYYVLIALGGGVLAAFMGMIFQAIGVKPDFFLQNWLVPCGAAGGVIIAAWLVEAKQNVIENMAPVLTRLFTPLFAALLLTFLGAVAVTGHGVGLERQILIAFDLLLAVVLGLLLYNMSARDPRSPAGGFDVLQIVLLVSALAVDAVALWAIVSRISEFGFSPNRVAALGENVLLLVNLAWSAVLYIRFARRQGSFASLERWQTSYLPVYATWAAIVVIAFPPLFRFA